MKKCETRFVDKMGTKQVINGKAFEYALVKAYCEYLQDKGGKVILCQDSACNNAKSCYDSFADTEHLRFDSSARATIHTLVNIEPGILYPKDETDVLNIRIAKDSEGQKGDVRDIIFNRSASKWEIGFSAKNDNDAVKHSRISPTIDIGKKWIGHKSSQKYWEERHPIFDYISQKLHMNPKTTWKEIGFEKTDRVYKPLLCAFRDEIMRTNECYCDVPKKLITYLIGDYPFYKIIKDDVNNMVVVKAFNINGELNKSYNGHKPTSRIPSVQLPTRIVELDFETHSDNTLCMILDKGWEITFRIHNASSLLERSLKFDIQLIGNPPILFSQYLFGQNEKYV